MFAVYASGGNAEDPLSQLVIGDQPEPEPAPGWVMVKVDAASLNMHDIWTLRGVGMRAEQYPMILGCDGAGQLPDGTPVVLYPVISAPDWADDDTLAPRRSLLSEQHQGTFADWVAVPERNVVRKPDELSTMHAAVLGTTWLTAYRMLFAKSGLSAGDRMLVQGASGGVASALIQLGRAAGFHISVTGRTAEKRALAQELGAHETYEPGARLSERVDAVFDSVGEATWGHSMRALRPGGVIVCCGVTTGPNPGADLARLVSLELRVEGSTMGTRAEFAQVLSFVAEHQIEPRIGLELPMGKAESGFARMLDGDTAGKIVFSR